MNPDQSFEQDYLTGLANRRALYEYYSQIDASTMIHAMFLDIDNFKRVNDIYGHSMGDKLLIAVSRLLQDHTQGFTSRIGGDEYVVLLDGSLTQPQVEGIASDLLSSIQEIDFRKDILSLISLSIGIVMEQPVSQNLDDVLTKCDAAMYQAKYNGKNQFAVYKSYDKTLEINRHIELEMDDTLKNGEFVVYFQPKVNMVSSELVGAEALARWIHPVDGIRPPAAFIPLFEKNGFISQLDLYMFKETCRIKSTWKGTKYEHIPISINMSRLHLYNQAYPDQLVEIADHYHIPTNELELEVTESIFLKDSTELIRMINQLQDRGFMISIDDFGSGFSALNLLKDLNANTIKLDREFLSNSSNSTRGKKIIRNVIALCLDLKMDVVTEGIETKDQIDFITRCGCQIGQGYYYAKPLCEKDFVAFAEEYLTNIRDSFIFHLDGSLKSEDGSREGLFCGDHPVTYGPGIFKDSKSLSFPGGAMEENTLELPPDCIVNDSFAISLWLYPEELYQWTAALYVKFETGFFGIIPYSWEGHCDFRLRDSKEVTGWYDAAAVQLHASTWWHVCASYNARTETLIAFINGEVVSVLENVPTNRYVKRIMLGGDVFQPSFVGRICEVELYNEAKDYEFMADLHQEYVTRKDFTALQLDDPIY